MLFNSLSFLVFFPPVVCLYFALPQKAKNAALLAASYVFYMGWNPAYALLLLFCTAVTFAFALLVERGGGSRRARAALLCGIFLILAVLFYYKYLNFSLELLGKLLALFHVELKARQFDIVLPVGISFFSFQAIGYLVDVHRREIRAERNFLKYALFVSFFPQLVAGPIERSCTLLRQLGTARRFDFANLKSGLFTAVWGYFLKVVVADRAAILVDFVYANESATGIQIALATFFFAFQIYCDFCGYSTIACGCAKILGIELTQNFIAPYFSASFSEFWRRWHISLSSWFRDYLYIPLGGNRKGRLRKNANTLAVMLVSGIWHGAGLTFVLWGLLHGAFQVLDDVTRPARERVSRGAGKIAQIALTFAAVCATWLVFRANSLGHALALAQKIVLHLEPLTIFRNNADKYRLETEDLKLLLLSIALIMLVDFARYRNVSVKRWILSRHWAVQAVALVALSLLVLVFGVWGSGYDAASFIYFQF